jgi:hypothetical protein
MRVGIDAGAIAATTQRTIMTRPPTRAASLQRNLLRTRRKETGPSAPHAMASQVMALRKHPFSRFESSVHNSPHGIPVPFVINEGAEGTFAEISPRASDDCRDLIVRHPKPQFLVVRE